MSEYCIHKENNWKFKFKQHKYTTVHSNLFTFSNSDPSFLLSLNFYQTEVIIQGSYGAGKSGKSQGF